MDMNLIWELGISAAGLRHVDRELSPAEYVETVRVEFEDGSTMTFNHAFCWVDERLTLIRTEHCGGYVVPHAGTLLVERLERPQPSPMLLSTNLLAPGFTILEEEGDEAT